MNVIQVDENGVAYGYSVLADNFRILFPTVSFPSPLTPEAVKDYGYGCYEFAAAPECEATQKAVEIAPQKGEDGIYLQSYEIVLLTDSELAARTEAQWAFVRNQRNFLLARTDWWVTKATETNTAISADQQTYRQALRDITDQADPFNIAWPVAPSIGE